MVFGNIPALMPSVFEVRATAIITNVVQFTGAQSCSGFDWLTLFLEYVRGAAGGAVQYQIQASPAVYAGWYPLSALAVGAVAVNVDTASNIQREMITYGATAAGAEDFVYGPILLRNTVENFRVSFVEVGVPGTPGQFGIIAVMGVNR